MIAESDVLTHVITLISLFEGDERKLRPTVMAWMGHLFEVDHAGFEAVPTEFEKFKEDKGILASYLISNVISSQHHHNTSCIASIEVYFVG